jgi:hypothetical protein
MQKNDKNAYHLVELVKITQIATHDLGLPSPKLIPL